MPQFNGMFFDQKWSLWDTFRLFVTKNVTVHIITAAYSMGNIITAQKRSGQAITTQKRRGEVITTGG